MGGGFQPVGQSHVLSNMVDFGMNVQEAIDCARAFHVGGKFEAERGIREDVLKGLAALGNEIKLAEMPHGGGKAILIDGPGGVLPPGSDTRKDGWARAYSTAGVGKPGVPGSLANPVALTVTEPLNQEGGC